MEGNLGREEEIRATEDGAEEAPDDMDTTDRDTQSMREQRAAEASAAIGPVITKREAAHIRAVPPHFTDRIARLAVMNGMGV